MTKMLSALVAQFNTLTSKLGLNTSCRIDLIKALLLCSIFSSAKHYDAAKHSETISTLHAAHIEFGSECLEKDFRDVWPELSTCFNTLYNEVGKRPRRFFALFHEQVVADWDSFQTYTKNMFPNEDFVINALTTIYYFSCLEEEYRKQGATNPPYDFYLTNKHFPNAWFDYELTEDVFTNLWSCMFYFKLDRVPVRIPKDLKAVIAEYDKHHIPHSKILGDYAVISKACNNLPAINEWVSIKRQLGQDSEYGISVDEGLFNVFASQMKGFTPTEVVTALFYRNEKRNDSAFEVGVLTKLFYAHIKHNDTVFLINPSPFMLSEIDSLRVRSPAQKIICVVNGTVLRDIYQKQFPWMQFISFDDQLDSVPLYDVALLTTRDWPVAEIDKLLQWSDHGNEDATLIACVPRTLFSGKNHPNVLQHFCKGFTARKIAVVTKKATNSSPRNKLLINFEKATPSGEYEIVLQETELDGKQFRFKNDSLRRISSNAFMSGAGMIRSSETSNVLSKRNAAKEVQYSKEIVLSYTTKQRGNKIVGRGYYCQMLSENEQTTRLRGKRLTQLVEKGLRCKNEEEVAASMLQKVPYYNEVAPFIIRDIRQQYQDRMGDLSLKTIWFCSRFALMAKSGYDDTISKNMFDTNAELANLKIGMASLDDYKSSMLPALKISTVSSLRLWQQLNLILNHAEKEHYISHNPIREYVSTTLTNQATKEQQEVRNALVKKHLTLEEERTILKFMSRNTSIRLHGTRIYRELYVVESIWLLGAIRLYTGLSVREACALTWGDLLENKALGFYQFAITKIVDDDGRLTSQVSDPEKVFRKIPIVLELAIMLQQRKNFLVREKGIPEKDLVNMPIILENENRKKKFCRPAVAAQTCRIIISSIGIAPNIIQLPDDKQGSIAMDLNKYYGDIFRSNFKYHANHTAHLSRGEINYILALEAPDTLSKHYCDYPNDFVQLGIAKKLHRWATHHISEQVCSQASHKEFESTEQCYIHKHQSATGIIKLEEYIDILPDDGEELIDVTATSHNGITGDIDYIKKR